MGTFVIKKGKKVKLYWSEILLMIVFCCFSFFQSTAVRILLFNSFYDGYIFVFNVW